ncbi:hypothetical protein CKAH01_11917 [Colletotrichum kahawae]|uniref:Uncharacterized protein n=1 Tax=Colletotrichum kahawae TaxID=34407 RepID=A0AAD9YSG3_COLKA|nr:hypothetical protein CKAH01_11917 [Colletotrichum kahawae]
MPPTHLISAHPASFIYRIWAFPIAITYAVAPSLPPRDQNRTIYRSSSDRTALFEQQALLASAADKLRDVTVQPCPPTRGPVLPPAGESLVKRRRKQMSPTRPSLPAVLGDEFRKEPFLPFPSRAIVGPFFPLQVRKPPGWVVHSGRSNHNA